jgi:hypothetical protein
LPVVALVAWVERLPFQVPSAERVKLPALLADPRAPLAAACPLRVTVPSGETDVDEPR